jgi:hypothetical protein
VNDKMPGIWEVMRLTMHNRRDVNASTKVGCVYCLRVYGPEEITQWTDSEATAICPHCSVDAVLPGSVAPHVDEAYLGKAHAYWFIRDRRPCRLSSERVAQVRA